MAQSRFSYASDIENGAAGVPEHRRKGRGERKGSESIKAMDGVLTACGNLSHQRCFDCDPNDR